MTVTYIAGMIAPATGGFCLSILWRMTGSRPAAEDLDGLIDVRWRSSRAIERLLDPADFDFLRRHGLSQARILALRAKRRRLFRMYLRHLTQDFHAVHRALRLIMAQSDTDRADLVRELGRQRMAFYRHLAHIEVRLALNAIGVEMALTIELIRPLEKLRMEFLNLAPATSDAQV